MLQVGDMDTDYAVFGLGVELDANLPRGLLDAQHSLVKLAVSHAPRLSDSPTAGTPAASHLSLRPADSVGPYPQKMRKRQS